MTGWEPYAVFIGLNLLLGSASRAQNSEQEVANQNRWLAAIEAAHHTERLLDEVLIHFLPFKTDEELAEMTSYIEAIARYESAQRLHRDFSEVLSERLYRHVPLRGSSAYASNSGIDTNTRALEQLFRDPEIQYLISDKDSGVLAAPPTREDLLSHEEKGRLEEPIRSAGELFRSGESNRSSPLYGERIESNIERHWQESLTRIRTNSTTISEIEPKMLSLVFDRHAYEKINCPEGVADMKKRIAKLRADVPLIWTWWDDEYRNNRMTDKNDPFSVISSPARCRDLPEKHWSYSKGVSYRTLFMRAFEIEVIYKSLRLFGSLEGGLEDRRAEKQDAKQTLLHGGASEDLIDALEKRIRMLYASIATAEWLTSRLVLRHALCVGVFSRSNINTPLRTPAELSVDHALLGIRQLLDKQTQDWLRQQVASLLAKDEANNGDGNAKSDRGEF